MRKNPESDLEEKRKRVARISAIGENTHAQVSSGLVYRAEQQQKQLLMLLTYTTAARAHFDCCSFLGGSRALRHAYYYNERDEHAVIALGRQSSGRSRARARAAR